VLKRRGLEHPARRAPLLAPELVLAHLAAVDPCQRRQLRAPLVIPQVRLFLGPHGYDKVREST